MKQGRAACPTFTGTRLSSISIDYGSVLTTKEITTIVETMTDSEDLSATITTVLGTEVT